MDNVPAKGNVLGRFIPARYILAILGSIGMGIVYGLKVNLSVAMVGMLNHTAIKGVNETPTINTELVPPLEEEQCKGSSSSSVMELYDTGPSGTQAVLPALFWLPPRGRGGKGWAFQLVRADTGNYPQLLFLGLLRFSNTRGAQVAELFSAKWVMFFSVSINIVCTLLTPLMAKLHPVAIILMRIGEGIGGGVTFPSMHVMLSRWAPPGERSVLAALVYAGTSLGTVLSMFMAGALTATIGWESVFYVMGGLSCTWCILWVVLIQDSPQSQPLISIEERNMILSSLGTKTDHQEQKKRKIPWKKVLTSPPFVVILVAHTCSNWGWYMVLIELPFYMKQVLAFNIKENTVVTAIPFFTLWIFSLGLSRLLDSLRARGTINTSWARKIATLFASLVPLVCLLALCYIGCHRSAAVVLMGVAITSIGGMFCGFLSNHIDIAPNYAGTLMALTNTLATLPGIIVPIFVGHLTHGNQTITAWRIIFYVTIGLYLLEIIVYTSFGSGEEQPWNKVDDENEQIEAEPLREESNGENSKNTVK